LLNFQLVDHDYEVARHPIRTAAERPFPSPRFGKIDSPCVCLRRTRGFQDHLCLMFIAQDARK